MFCASAFFDFTTLTTVFNASKCGSFVEQLNGKDVEIGPRSSPLGES